MSIVKDYLEGNLTEYNDDIDIESAVDYVFYSYPTLKNVSFPVCEEIGYQTFYNCSVLTDAEFPACVTIGNNAFESCSSLSTISFPICVTIGNNAFSSCYSLSIADFPSCTTIGSSAFNQCSKLIDISFSKCTDIKGYAFQSCSSLASVYFPACETISNYAFMNCPLLSSAEFPACTTIGSYAFAECYSLSDIDFPICTTIDSYVFASCSSIVTVSFPTCVTIGGYAFQNCISLTSMYLIGSSIATLTSTDVFFSTPMSDSSYLDGVYGSIYVPFSLVSSYRASTNWSIYSARIVGLDENMNPVADDTGLGGIITRRITEYVDDGATTTIGQYAFSPCVNLTMASFPNCTTINSYAFYSCYSLESLYLTGDSVATLASTNALGSTPMSSSSYLGYFGSVYVPSSLLATYQSASAWSAYSSRFVGI